MGDRSQVQAVTVGNIARVAGEERQIVGERHGDDHRVNNARRYARSVLQSFGDRETERVWRRATVRKFHGLLQRIGLRKLAVLDAADTLADLRIPPGNRLEKLHGDRDGQHGIRINDQWRICFRWTKAGPEQVTITDYH